MPRGKRKIKKRQIQPDPVYNSPAVTRFTNKVMREGKKALAQRIVYQALQKAAKKTGKDALEVFNKAVENVIPSQEVRSRRVGGATYQVPTPVKKTRGETLAMRWIIEAAKSKKDKPMEEKLAEEFLAAFGGTGEAVKKKNDTHRMAEANRAFSHFRW